MMRDPSRRHQNLKNGVSAVLFRDPARGLRGQEIYIAPKRKREEGDTHRDGRLGKKAKENKLLWPLNIHDGSLAEF